MGVFRQGLTLIASLRQWFWRTGLYCGLCCLVASLCLTGGAPALAGANDDFYDGNIFALYAGNGALVPPRINLPQSLAQKKPTIVFFFVDDSRDCKTSSLPFSQLQAPYGRVANFVPVMADSIPIKDQYETNEPGYYFKGSVPQTVIFDGEGQVRFDSTGELIYEDADDVFREIFDLLPRDQSVQLRRRPSNELNSELVAD